MPFESVLDIADRHKPATHSGTRAYRGASELPFDAARARELPVLLDTTVYIDRLRGTLPGHISELIASRPVFHSAVACAEMSISLGILDPCHPSTAQNARAIRSTLAAMRPGSLIEPSAATWIEAGIVAGILARTQGLAKPRKALTPDQACCQRGRRRELLNDALIYLTAVDSDSLLISANTADMDLLQQLRPSSNLLLYHRLQPGPRT